MLIVLIFARKKVCTDIMEITVKRLCISWSKSAMARQSDMGAKWFECSCKSTGIACVWGVVIRDWPRFQIQIFIVLRFIVHVVWNSYNNLLLPLLTPLLWRCLSMLLLSPMRHSKQLQINCRPYVIIFMWCLLAVACFRLPIEKTHCESRMS